MLERHFEFWPTRAPKSLSIPETNIWYNLDVSARRYPDKPAIVFYGAEVPYRQLADEVERMAGYLRDEGGVRGGDRVILYLQNSPQFVIAFYATLRVGGVVVPLNPMNVTEELRFYLEDSEARVAFAGQELLAQIAPLVGATSLERIVVAAYSEYAPADTDLPAPDVVRAARQQPDGPGIVAWADALRTGGDPGPLDAGPDDLAVLPYTSGTTGRPKGCMHTHRTVQATLVGAVVWNDGTSSGATLATLPFFHVTGMQHSMNGPIFSGSTIVLMTRWDRELSAELIQRYRVTHWTNISTMVVDFLSNPRIGEYDLGSLVLVGGGGAPLPAAIGEKLLQLTGLRYAEGYGLSETISQTHMNPPDRPKMQCLGIPSFDVDARVIDPETLREVGPNTQGEIVVHGPQVLQGYWRRPEETERAFIDLDGKRFFRTGDIAMYDEEGYFFMTDRLKRMINAGGFKVWPAEVESTLYRHPAIREAAVIGTPDERRGETVKAVVVLNDGERGRVSEADIIAWAREQMAAYKRPRVVEFVDALPKSGTGKIQWRQLQEREDRVAAG